jgi:hypothetical protein
MVMAPADESIERFRFRSDAYLPDLVIAGRNDLGGAYANTAEGGSGQMGTRFDVHTTLTPPLDLTAGELTLAVEAIETMGGCRRRVALKPSDDATRAPKIWMALQGGMPRRLQTLVEGRQLFG